MPLRSLEVSGFRAFDTTGPLPLGPLTGFVGRNDCGKSGLLHALRVFFEPPKKGLLATDLHLKDSSREAVIALAFDLASLPTTKLKVDAKNLVDLTSDRLVAADGMLHARVRFSAGKDAILELLISDIDDDALFPLALRNQEELLALLIERGLPAKKAGKETNESKRAALRAHAAQAGSGLREAWHDATSIEKPLRELLPEWIYFPDTARFGIDETPVQNQFKSIVDKAIPSQAEAQLIETAIRTSVQAEFNKIFEFMVKMTPSIEGLTADTKVSWKKAVDSIALTWSDKHGVELPYELRGAGIRRLFMVAYFQYVAAESLYSNVDKRYLFAIEEPELHLHPGAQRELITALQELGALGHTVVFTTHSPVFASAPPSESLILVRRDTAASQAVAYPHYDASHLAHELGVEASDRLVGRDHVILVEGPGDVQFYEYLLGEHYAAGLTALDPGKVLFLQCGGTNNLNFVATTGCMTRAGLKWAILMDSDREVPGGECGPVVTRLTSSPPQSCLAIQILDRSFIESYYDSASIAAETGIACVVPAFGRATDVSGQRLTDRQWNRVKKAGAAIARRMGHAQLVAQATGGDGSCEWTRHFETIRVAFGI